jgi:hypothetical protein
MNKFCYVVMPTQRDKNGFIPSMVKEGEMGHYPMMGKGECASPWYWGKTLKEAEEICKEANKKLGLTDKEVEELTLYSMFGV